MQYALCTQCNFGIEQVVYINIFFGSNRQETCTILKHEQSAEKEETREIDALLIIFPKC
jgi:hypothetical protein